MSDRTTGATAAQIEAAAKRWYELAYGKPDGVSDWDLQSDEVRDNWKRATEYQAEIIVQPDQAIVGRADLRAVIKYADDRIPEESMDKANEAALDRLREVLGE